MHNIFFGTVIRGRGKGKKMGFPTINIKLVNCELPINKGVYVVWVTINNQIFKGMMYTGTRPTFELQKTTIEIHLLDYQENIYDMQISFQILHKIREEIHFENVGELVRQLHHDKEMVYKYFGNLIN